MAILNYEEDASWFTLIGGMNLNGPITPETFVKSDNDNQILFAAYYQALGGTIPQTRWDQFMLEVGNPNRSPGRSEDTDAWDNSLALCFLSYSAALAIYKYGRDNAWYYDCTHKANFSWTLWRQPSQVYVIKVASNIPPTRLEKIWFEAALYINGFCWKDGESAIMTQWLACELLKRKGIVPKMYNNWEDAINKKYGNIGGVFKVYFKNNLNHPIMDLVRTRWP